MALLADAVAAGRVGQRVRVFLGDADELTAARHAARGRVEIAGVKLLPARAEEIAEPRFSRTVARARRCGLPVAIHAVEADAIDAALRALAAAPPRHGESAAPDRIEHASLCPPELSARIAAAGVAVVTQPAFLAERAVKYREEVEPPLWPWLYPLATLRAAGALVVGSSDAPVASADPRLAIAAAIGRSDGRGPAFAASEALDEAAALALYTSAPRALRGEAAPGPWLVPGRPADLLVLDRDPRGCWRDAVVVEARVGRGAARPSHAPAEGAA